MSAADIIILTIITILTTASAFRRLRENERAAVFRLGKLIRIEGPGLVVVLPIIDRVRTVHLDEEFPYWKGMSKREIDERIRHELQGS